MEQNVKQGRIKESDGRMWTGFSWLKIEITRGLL
jgi:hypothetical protein